MVVKNGLEKEPIFHYFKKSAPNPKFSNKNNNLSAWRDFKISFSRPLFTMIFSPKLMFLVTDSISRLKTMTVPQLPIYSMLKVGKSQKYFFLVFSVQKALKKFTNFCPGLLQVSGRIKKLVLRLGAQCFRLLNTLRDPTQLRRRQWATRQQHFFFGCPLLSSCLGV